MYIRDEDLWAVSRLWGELAEFPAAQADEALHHCFSRLAHLIGAENLFWVGATHDPAAGPRCDRLGGWWPRAVRQLLPNTQRDRLLAEVMQHLKASIVDPHT